MEYKRTQHGPWHWFLWVFAGLLAAATCFRRPYELGVILLMLGIIGMIIFLSLTCRSMTIQDEGEHLLVYFGFNIIPCFRRKIPYTDILSFERGHFSFMDGCGVHYFPFRGWSYRIWGFNCVKLTFINKKVIRIGTNDVDNLMTFLQQKCRK
jgi:hypothetical protein